MRRCLCQAAACRDENREQKPCCQFIAFGPNRKPPSHSAKSAYSLQITEKPLKSGHYRLSASRRDRRKKSTIGQIYGTWRRHAALTILGGGFL
jgi:hypothetical protein